ncbi:MAG: RNA-binding protein [Acidobacteria bacterium]|nr:RNA-binding protein [Acidobacteriota bacterium]
MLADALEHLVRGIVDSPEDVKVTAKNNRRGETLEVHVHQDDLGRVIGRQGRTARALRTVIAALAGGESVRVDVVDTDRRR